MGSRNDTYQFVIEIDCGNAAFGDGKAYEIARILEDLARKARNGEMTAKMTLYDVNGNKVGSARLT